MKMKTLTKRPLQGVIVLALARAVRCGQFLTVLTVALGVLAVWTPPAAHAVAILELSDGVTSIQVTDNGVGDTNPVLGAITFLGSIGNFMLNVTTGISQPVIGSPNLAAIDLNSVNVTTGGGGTLVISFTDTGFTLPIASNTSTYAVGGVLTAPAGSGTTFQAFLDNTNTLFGTGTQLANLAFGPGAFAASVPIGVTTANPFSLTQIATLTFTGPGSVSFNGLSQTAVPEPTSLLLLGSGLAGLGLLGRKKFKV